MPQSRRSSRRASRVGLWLVGWCTGKEALAATFVGAEPRLRSRGRRCLRARRWHSGHSGTLWRCRLGLVVAIPISRTGAGSFEEALKADRVGATDGLVLVGLVLSDGVPVEQPPCCALHVTKVARRRTPSVTCEAWCHGGAQRERKRSGRKKAPGSRRFPNCAAARAVSLARPLHLAAVLVEELALFARAPGRLPRWWR